MLPANISGLTLIGHFEMLIKSFGYNCSLSKSAILNFLYCISHTTFWKTFLKRSTSNKPSVGPFPVIVYERFDCSLLILIYFIVNC